MIESPNATKETKTKQNKKNMMVMRGTQVPEECPQNT